MDLDHDICYRALRTRDARFDGRFFTGVTSTGVYCRPVCPARTPYRANCTFFACTAAAEEAGFRPCRRCRPETSPGTPAWRGTSATVSRALRLIEDGALDTGGVTDLAQRLGVGDRHLRRLFADHLGASPLAVAQSRRVHFAKRLIEESDLTMTGIAFAAGFGTVRRFNAAVRRCFERTPTEIRRAARAGPSSVGDGHLSLLLPYRAPFDWDGLLKWLAPRAIPGVEQVHGMVYRRTSVEHGFCGVIEIKPAGHNQHALVLRVPRTAASRLLSLVQRARRLGDLDADPAAIGEQLSTDDLVAGLSSRYPGTRVAGCWDPFELAVRAILGQQISVAAATRLAGKLVQIFGRPVTTESGASFPASYPDRLFPTPKALAVADLTVVGLPAARARTIQVLARAVCQDEPILDLAPDLETTVLRLTALPGIGDWTAQYIAMRSLREPDAFPAGDLGLRKALADSVGSTGRRSATGLPSVAAVRRRAEAWRPWRAYAAMLLWKELGETNREVTP